MPWTPKQAGYMAVRHPQIFKREKNKLGSDLIKTPPSRPMSGYSKKGK